MVAWTLLLSFVTLCVIIVAFVAHRRGKASDPSKDPLAATPNRNIQGDRTGPQLDEERALGIVRDALRTREPNEIARYFMTGSTGDGVTAVGELARISELEGEPLKMEFRGESYKNGTTLVEVVVHRGESANATYRMAQLLACPDGEWRIDLDSYLRRVEPSWDRILKAETGTFLVRVFVAQDNYYNGSFSDESVWSAYSIASPDVDETLYAYAKRGSRQDNAIISLLADGPNPQKATLRISKPLQSTARQYEITSVVAEDWVIGDRDFDLDQ